MHKVFLEYKEYNGETGPSNVLTIGTVESGEEASASITGTSPNQVLNLVLPKGDKGDTGEQGPKGETGETGPQGPTGERGLQGEQGIQGIQGEKGEKGDKGDKGEQGATGANGYTPVKGIDYWTNEDKQEIIEDVEEEINPTIEALQEELAEVKAENEDLKNNQLTGESSGQSIYLSDSADSRVRSIGLSGNSEQESTTGKQLFNAYNIPSSTSIVVEDNGETIKLPIATSGNGYVGANKKLYQLCPTLQVGDTVYLYFNRNLGTTYNNFIYLVEDAQIWNNGIAKTITQEMLNSEVVLYGNRYSDGETTQCIITDFRITKTENATYEPYTGGQASPNPSYPQEIHSTGDSGSVNEKVQNKNLVKLNSTLNTTRNNVEISYNEQTKKVKFTGTINNTFTYSGTMSLDEPLKPGTYVLSIDGNNRAFMYLRNSQGNVVKNVQTTNPVVTITEEVTSLNFGIEGLSNGETVDIEIGYQLEQGTTATDYVAHEEQNISIPTQQPMRSNKNKTVVDGFVNVDGNRIERHYIGRLILTGEEDIEGGNVDGGTTGVSKRFYITHNLTNLTPAITSDGLMCSNFVVGSTYGNDDTLIQLSSTLIFLRINVNDYSNLTTKNELKAWLAQRYANGNPVYIDYILATPLDLPCTEEQVQALEALEKARTYKPITHISSTDEVPATVDITYVRDLETVINNLTTRVETIESEV